MTSPIVEPKQHIIVATILSLFFYTSILFGIFFYLGHSQEIIQRFTSKKDDFLDVTLVQRKSIPKPIQKKKQIIKNKAEPERVVKPTPVKQITAKKEIAKKSTDLKNLFKSIDTSKLADPAPISAPRPKVQSRLKPTQKEVTVASPKNEAKNLTQSLDLETKPVSMISQSKGTYDPYRGKVSEILDSNWQETISTVSGAEAKVKIQVDYQGTFSYTIVSMSYNDAFNAKLRDFLEAMRDETFPPYQDGEVMTMIVNFKDTLER